MNDSGFTDLSQSLNDAAERTEEAEKKRDREETDDRDRREHQARANADLLNEAAQAAARKASEATAETVEVTRFLRPPKRVVTRETSFYLAYATPGLDYKFRSHRVSISTTAGFVLSWNDPDARDVGGITTLEELLTDSPGSAGILQRLLSEFMAKHGIRI